MFSILEEDIASIDPLEILLQEENISLIEAAIDSLSNEQMKDVIRKRFFDNLTLREIGEHYNKSPERIRQIEARALRCLRHPRRAKLIVHIYLGYEIEDKPEILTSMENIIKVPKFKNGYEKWSYDSAYNFYIATKKKAIKAKDQTIEKGPIENVQENIPGVAGIHTLSNGRIYRVLDTGTPYAGGEYPYGGFHISVKLPSGNWSYIDNSPDEECVRNFLKAARRLSPFDTKLK